MSQVEHLFVYGTLKRGRSPQAEMLAASCLWVTEATISGRLVNLGAYPGLLPQRQLGEVVHGEVWRLPEDEKLLVDLDRYEGCHESDPQPHEYRRIQVYAELPDRSQILCWAYACCGSAEDKPKVEGGSW